MLECAAALRLTHPHLPCRAVQRESLLIETSTLNFVVLMDGALTSSAEFAYGSGAEAGKTVMNLKYMPDGGAMRLNGQFALELVSDSIASEVSELLFSLPTSEVVEGARGSGVCARVSPC